ncbi:hypothetical protein niasHT_004602 [Heterodera trifolii]|uniref:V-SNARE coiled-coil homology domain-containing protein n=1 Tax=Heterodera trifolii TaxID=157864 RepID=A0ABD2M9N2_9BILA
MDPPSVIASADANGGQRQQSGDVKIEQVRNQLDGVTTVMSQNVERILERGERLDQLDNRSQALHESSQSFTHTSQRVQRRMCLQSMKWSIIFGLFLCVMLLLLVLTILRIFNVI